MTTKRKLCLGVAAIAIAVALTGATGELRAQGAPPAVAIDNDDIGGVVTGANGPEAGVWVIAETRDLAVRYIKIVVTDDQGRYVLPDLPKALDEIRRVLRPGGSFAIVYPCDPGLAYEVARKISAERIFRRTYHLPYGWLIRREHINSPGEIETELGKRFTLSRREAHS